MPKSSELGSFLVGASASEFVELTVVKRPESLDAIPCLVSARAGSFWGRFESIVSLEALRGFAARLAEVEQGADKEAPLSTPAVSLSLRADGDFFTASCAVTDGGERQLRFPIRVSRSYLPHVQQGLNALLAALAG